MAQNRNSEHVQQLEKELSSESREEQLVTFLGTYGTHILVTLAVLLVAILLGYVWHMVSRGKAETDYLTAETAFQKLEAMTGSATPITDNPDYIALQTMLAKHPELESRYDGRLAQTFLRLGDMNLAVVYADKALKQLATENLPFYEEYSKTSLLIAQGNYRDALKRATFLQKRMREQSAGSDHGFLPDLLTLNQIRLAALYQQLKMPAEELKAWQESGMAIHTERSTVLDSIKTGQITLQDFIQAREKALRI